MIQGVEERLERAVPEMLKKIDYQTSQFDSMELRFQRCKDTVQTFDDKVIDVTDKIKVMLIDKMGDLQVQLKQLSYTNSEIKSYNDSL